MSASTTMLLVELAQRGIRVRAADGRIACSPATALTDDLRRRIVIAKAELLELLGAPPAEKFALSPLACTDKTAKSPPTHPFVSSVSSQDRALRENGRPVAVCLSCYGTRFVRLRNGRRSVCFGCEQPAQFEIAGEDAGVVGGAA